jgi:threonine synthase
LGLVNGRGIWRWQDWLPRVGPENQISLGEGCTPLVRLDEPRVWLKNETVNPTWSWKDRPNALSVAMARELGFSKVVATSTGNHGSAAAAYASRAGIRCTIFCHPDAPRLQRSLMASYGAEVVLGGDRAARARDAIQTGGVFPSTVLCPHAGYSNPYGVEGFKTIAFEIVRDLGRAPECVFVPVGSGDGIYGIWKGFRELHQAGVSDKAPRMIACQASGANSAVRAFAKGSHHVEPVEASTVALSIAENEAGGHAMRAIFESGGAAIEATDEEILAAQTKAARQGFAIEAASATALAAAIKVAESYEAVVIATGAGVKWPDQFINSVL